MVKIWLCKRIRVKRKHKIWCISIASILGLIVLVVGLAIWVIFTPERLTPIVRSVAKEYVTCAHTIERVELTFVSTFPYVGLEINNFVVNNPMEGAPSDTVLAIPQLIVSLDVVALLKHDTLSISNLLVPDMQVNMFVDADGHTNYDVLALPEDTMPEDTTGLPFNHIRVDNLTLSATQISFVNLQDTIDLGLQDAMITANVVDWDDLQLAVDIKHIDVDIAGEQLANDLSLQLTLPAAVDMDNMSVTLHQARLIVDDLAMTLDGWASFDEDIQTDMRVTTTEWQLDNVMHLLPIELDKDISNLLAGGKISLDATATIDMADDNQSKVIIHNANASFKNTNIGLHGIIKNPMGNLWVDLATDMNLPIADIKTFLPSDMRLAGRVKGKAQVQMYLDDLLSMQLHKGKLLGDLQLLSFQYSADGINASLPNNRLEFQIPNPAPSRKEVDWLAATLQTNGGKVSLDTSLMTTIGKSNIAVELNNILSSNPYLHATLALQSKEQIHALMDSMDMTIAQPTLKTYVAYHMTDTNIMPVVDAKLDFERVQGYYTDIHVNILPSTLTASLRAPRMSAELQTRSLHASMAEALKLQTQDIKISAAARYNAHGGDNMLLKWNPKLSVDMHDAALALADWEQTIQIPNIDFSYTNRACEINQSNLIIGNSDFSLTGQLTNIGRWMRNKAVLEGELTFESNYTDVDELLALLSADQGADEDTQKQAEVVEAEDTIKDPIDPFMVPTNVDITLNTKINKASAFGQTATNLGGKLYVKNGELVIEEMGLMCDAAKLQLTALYRTPRRNHIYVGFDYHMIDVNIEELIGLIPQLDTMMPMLRSFKGEAEFHLAAETYTNEQYQIKPSTLRGAASIYGKDLVVLDSETFSKISKLLMFNKKTENKVDSISAELTLYKKEIDVYPFCVSMDNYMVALGGQHNLDMSFNYDINVLSPIYLGVNVSGNIDDLDIKLVPCKFAKDFKPLFKRKVDTQSAELRTMIRESMRKNVKIESTK